MTSIGDVIGARTAVIVDDAVASAKVRGNWQLARYALLDRGSYEYAHDVDEPDLFAVAQRVVERVTERSLHVAESTVLRLGPGDYLLARHDRIHDGFPVEVVFDLSPAIVPGAELHYRRRGAVFFRFSSQPRAASIVERGPSVTCNHTYVSKRNPGASVVRLVLLLRE